MIISPDRTCDICKSKGLQITLSPWQLCYNCALKAFQEYSESHTTPEEMDRFLRSEKARLDKFKPEKEDSGDEG